MHIREINRIRKCVPTVEARRPIRARTRAAAPWQERRPEPGKILTHPPSVAARARTATPIALAATRRQRTTRACAVDHYGLAQCFGQTDHPRWPWTIPPPDDTALRSLSCGAHHVCGLTDRGVVRCFGNDTYGQASPPTE